MKPRTKFILQLIYIFGTLGIVAWLTLTDDGFQSLGGRLDEFSVEWILIAFLSIVIYWIFQGVILHYIGAFSDARLPFRKDFKIAIIGEYYSAITPFASGGQPIQMAYYKGYGIGLAKSSAILAIRFAGFQFSLCVYYVVMMILNGSYYYDHHAAIFWITFAGFCVNLFSVTFIVLIMVKRSFVEWLGLGLMRLWSKIYKRFQYEMHIEKFQRGLDDFTAAAGYIKKNKLKALKVMLISIVGCFFYFSISYYVYRATGCSDHSLVEVMSLQIFLYLAVSFFPTPGAAGATEIGFGLFFQSIFPPEFLSIAILLWRFVSYYTNLIVGAGVIVWDEITRIIHHRAELRSEQSGPKS